ncbi:hypothetical protein JCM8547_003010 [Rhodosporidiobolus lusitaniae]
MPALTAPAAAAPPDPFQKYATFLHSNFEADAFAHAVLNGEEYPAPAEGEATNGVPASGGGFMKGLVGEGGTGDVSAALARLNFGVEDLNRQLKGEVIKHHSSLLLQAASLGGLDGDLTEVRRGLAEVEGGVSRLKRKIAAPHEALSSSLLLLTRLRRAASLARRAQRFMVLARRLEGQMGDITAANADTAGSEGRAEEKRDRAMAEAALTLAEIETLLSVNEAEEQADDDPEALLPIRLLVTVEAAIPSVELSRQLVVEEMESAVQRGLTGLDHPTLASSLQTAHNLSVLPSLVESLTVDLNELVYRKVKACFDMASLAREMAGKEAPTNAASAFVYKSRTRNEPTQATMPQWASAMWARLESLIDDMGSICIKVYTLEKVLKLKKDQNTQMSFLDEAMTVLDNKPSSLFWTALAQAFESQAQESVRNSVFIQNILSTGYPRLLRLFQEFFSKIAVHTDTVYTLSHQSPETILVLRAIQPFETLYLTRSTNRLTEAVGSAFNITSSLASSFSARPPAFPTANEGIATARAVVNELDAARFDPLLAKAIAKGAGRAVETYIGRAEGLLAHDHSATSLLGPLATPSQQQNADITSSLYHLWLPLERALAEHTESVREILRPSVDRLRSSYLSAANPLIMSIRRDFSALLARMHRVNYGQDVDPLSGSGGGGGAGASAYMQDLTDKLSLVKDEILGAYRVGELAKDWALDLARFTVQTFLLHASLVHPLGESGKLKLTSDTTALEFAVSQYLAAHGMQLKGMGDQFKALRAFRPLLFLDVAALSSPTHTADVPNLILLHHIISRSSPALRLPNEEHGWTEAEYVRWLNEHGEKERVGMVEGVVRRWEESGKEEGREAVELIKTILARSGTPSSLAANPTISPSTLATLNPSTRARRYDCGVKTFSVEGCNAPFALAAGDFPYPSNLSERTVYEIGNVSLTTFGRPQDVTWQLDNFTNGWTFAVRVQDSAGNIVYSAEKTVKDGKGGKCDKRDKNFWERLDPFGKFMVVALSIIAGIWLLVAYNKWRKKKAARRAATTVAAAVEAAEPREEEVELEVVPPAPPAAAVVHGQQVEMEAAQEDRPRYTAFGRK